MDRGLPLSSFFFSKKMTQAIKSSSSSHCPSFRLIPLSDTTSPERIIQSGYVVIGRGSCPEDVDHSQFYSIGERDTTVSHKHVGCELSLSSTTAPTNVFQCTRTTGTVRSALLFMIAVETSFS